eukprot:SM008260S22577  [mRNA]  locus=s8260:153:581:- [translate_table: standard]
MLAGGARRAATAAPATTMLVAALPRMATRQRDAMRAPHLRQSHRMLLRECV